MRVLFLLLLLALGGCAVSQRLPPPAVTSKDLDNDRVLVTMRTEVPAGAAALSPSGRLDYRPPDISAVRETQLGKARAIAAALDLEIEEDWAIPALDVHCFVFRLSSSTDRDELIHRLSRHEDVESVQPLQFFETRSSMGADPLAGWERMTDIPLLALHRRATGADVTIAVIDAGLDVNHEDLRGADLGYVDFVDGLAVPPPEAHGTAIVGLLAARPGNGIGIRGYAPDARILLIRACWEKDAEREIAVCNSFTLAKAMSLALQSEADIVNMSVRGPRDPLLERLGAEIARRNALLIAAGADGESFPASVPGSVVAVRDLPMFPTSGALTLLPGDRYGMRNGNSMTTARLAGVAALLRELDPALSANAFVQLLSQGALRDAAAVASLPAHDASP